MLRRVFFKKNPARAAKQIAPHIVFLMLVVLIGVTAYKGLAPLWKRFEIDPFSMQSSLLTLAVAVTTGAIGVVVTRFLLRDYDTEMPDSPNPLLHADVARSLGKAMMAFAPRGGQRLG